MRAFAFEIEHRVDHVLDDARAGDLAFLGDMADQHDRGTCGFRIADDALRRGAHLCDRAGRRISEVGPKRLDGIEDDEIGPPAFGDRRQDVLDIGLGGEFDRRRGRAEALGAQPDLRHGFLARHVDDPVTAIGECCGGLHEEGGFADARIAANEDGRAAHEPAACGAVEFSDA